MNAKLIVDRLLEGDRYDDMDLPIARMRQRVDQLAAALAQAGLPVGEKTYPDYEVDGEVVIGDSQQLPYNSIQVTLDGNLILNEYSGEGDDFGSTELGQAKTIPGILAIVSQHRT